MAKVKIGLRGLTTAQKLEKAKRIIRKVASSEIPDKTTLPVSQLHKAANMLGKAIEMAEFGDKRAIAARKLCEKQVEQAIRKMAMAVEQVTEQDRRLIEAAGFELRSTNNRSQPLSKPESLTPKRLDDEGSIGLKWRPVSNSKSYLVQTCTSTPNSKTNWQTSAYTTKSRCTIDNLKVGTRYWFRVKAIGAKGIGPPSTTASIVAA